MLIRHSGRQQQTLDKHWTDSARECMADRQTDRQTDRDFTRWANSFMLPAEIVLPNLTLNSHTMLHTRRSFIHRVH